jgi:predicted house-cleaning noncanonical NTP pyrophosphatase (MazG superfamily)
MAVHLFKFNKLCRDKISELMRRQGVIVHERIMENKEFIIRLKEKLLEETQEAIETNSKEELSEELADILEVMHALAKTSQISFEEIEKKRQNKQLVKGGFEKKIYCSHIELDSENPATVEYLNYYKTHPRYPEIK